MSSSLTRSRVSSVRTIRRASVIVWFLFFKHPLLISFSISASSATSSNSSFRLFSLLSIEAIFDRCFAVRRDPSKSMVDESVAPINPLHDAVSQWHF